jgi:hypothetical protein
MRITIKSLLYKVIKIFDPIIPNVVYNNILFLINCVRLRKSYYFLKLRQPKTFNEKISYIKFNIKNPLSPIVADKYLVRDYVSNKIGEAYLIPLIKVFEKVDEINFSELPNKFVIKLNNGSGFNLICFNKSKLDINQIMSNYRKAMKTDVYLLSREWHYNIINPKIIIEELIGENIHDYKFFCDHNGPFMIQVDIDRFTCHKRNLYDLEWNLMPIRIRYENASETVAKPSKLNEMIKIAKTLSSDFVFSRIDLYQVKNKVLFGEITLHPGGGVEPFDSYDSDLKMGELIDLSY